MSIVNGLAHSNFNIPHSEEFFPCLLLFGFHFPGFLFVGIYIFPTQTDSRKYTNISHYYLHHEGTGRSPMHIHVVEGKSVVNYPHHECTEFITKHFHEENSRALLTS
jgi:hypothetical protein